MPALPIAAGLLRHRVAVPMIGVLEDVWHATLDVPYLVIGLLVTAINGWIVAIAAVVNALYLVLPSFPAVPEIPDGVGGVISWAIPIVPLLGVFSAFLSAYVIWLGLRIGLRWGKAD